MRDVKKGLATMVFLAIVMFLVLPATEVAGTDELKVGTLFNDLATLPIAVGVEKGFYKQEGLNIRLVNVSSPTSKEALQAGDIDAHTLASPGVIAVERGLDAKMVMALVETATASLVASSEINSLSDLKGRKVAVNAIGYLPHRLLVKTLTQAGVDPSQVTFIGVGASPSRLAAIRSREAAATILYPPYDTIATRIGFRILLKNTDFPRYPDQEIWMRASDMEKRPELFRRFLRGTLNAIDWLRKAENRTDALALVRKLMGVDKTAAELGIQEAAPAIAEEIYRTGTASWSRTGRVSVQEVSLMVELTLGKTAEDPRKFFDFRLLP